MIRDDSGKTIVIIDDSNTGEFTVAVRRVAAGGALIRAMNPALMGGLTAAPPCRAYMFAPGVEARFPAVRALMKTAPYGVWELGERAVAEFNTLYGQGSAANIWRSAIDIGLIEKTQTTPPQFIYGDEIIGAGAAACLEKIQSNPELLSRISKTLDEKRAALKNEAEFLFNEAITLEVISKKGGRHRFGNKNLPAKKQDVISLLERDSALLGALRRAVG